MRTAGLACAALLLVAGLTAPPAQAQIFCIDFVNFCDGLEVTIEGSLITGWWRNYDCDGSDASVIGIVQDGLPGPCHQGPATEREPQWPGKAGIVCEPELGCDAGGDEWYFILDGTDNTLDVGLGITDHPRPGACAVDEVTYEVLLGPCPFFGPGDGVSSISSAQAALTSEASP